MFARWWIRAFERSEFRNHAWCCQRVAMLGRKTDLLSFNASYFKVVDTFEGKHLNIRLNISQNWEVMEVSCRNVWRLTGLLGGRRKLQEAFARTLTMKSFRSRVLHFLSNKLEEAILFEIGLRWGQGCHGQSSNCNLKIWFYIAADVGLFGSCYDAKEGADKFSACKEWIFSRHRNWVRNVL